MNQSVVEVRNHITSIFAKLEVENRSQAIVLARDARFGRRGGQAARWDPGPIRSGSPACAKWRQPGPPPHVGRP